MAPYAWTVIGAGPVGIAAVGKLLDRGIAADKIAWIDPAFAAGDIGGKWRSVSSNTQVRHLLDYMNGSAAFGFAEAPPMPLRGIDPEETCALALVADPLVWITGQLRERVHVLETTATAPSLHRRQWTIETQQEEITSQNVVLAVGAAPKKLSIPHLDEIPVEVALDLERLADLPLEGATVAVFGSPHSSMIVLPHLLRQPVAKLINFYRGPLKYTVYLDDWILFDDTGLKGRAAVWARENIDGVYPERLERCSVSSPEYDEKIAECDRVVYAVGLRHLIGGAARKPSAHQQRRAAASPVDRAEPSVDPQPRRQHPHPDHLVGVDGIRRLRQETHCGQSEHAPHGQPHAPVSGADLNDLLVQQRNGRTMRTAVLLGKSGSTLRQVEQHPGRHIVEVREAGLRGQRTPPRRVHRESGIDVARRVHRGQAPRQRVRGHRHILGSHRAHHHAARQHVETGCHPSRQQPVRASAEPNDRRVVEPHRVIDERGQVCAVGSAGLRAQPHAPLGYRTHRCRCSRCRGESRTSRCSSMWTVASCDSAMTAGLESGDALTGRTS